MHRRVFISFLGTGDYEPTTYYLGTPDAGHRSAFVQAAELALLGPFDRAFVLCTEASRQKHLDALTAEAACLGIEVLPVEIDTALGADHQWGSFERVLGLVDVGDRLTFDFTHGFRSVSIILSAALEFVRRARSAHVERVLYGAWSRGDEYSEIIDMTGFYEIASWTDAVGRLIDDADARALTNLAERDQARRFAALSNPELIESLRRLTDAVRNVEAPQVEQLARSALEHVERSSRDADLPSRVLLQLVADKFVDLTRTPPRSGRLDHDFFRTQQAFMRLLIEHGLLMQALTVMNEYVGALGARADTKTGHGSGTAWERFERVGSTFVQMVLRDERAWEFPPDRQSTVRRLRPAFDALAEAGLLKELRAFMPDLRKLRNGFDHAWMNRAGEAGADVGSKVSGWLDRLVDITDQALALPDAEPEPEAPVPFLNLSNHPSNHWPAEQRRQAEDRFGPIVDFPGGFPAVPPDAKPKDVKELAKATVARVKDLCPERSTIFVAGEHRLTAVLVARLQKRGHTCVVATSHRDASEHLDADDAVLRRLTFRFEGWAEYPPLG